MEKVLVVDDDESILDAVSLVLEESGYTVETTKEGQEIYQKIHSFKPDIILLDVLLSGDDGRHICKKIKADQATKGISVIMISAHPSAKQGAVQCGADDFLAKPFETEELLQTIRKHILK